MDDKRSRLWPTGLVLVTAITIFLLFLPVAYVVSIQPARWLFHHNYISLRAYVNYRSLRDHVMIRYYTIRVDCAEARAHDRSREKQEDAKARQY